MNDDLTDALSDGAWVDAEPHRGAAAIVRDPSEGEPVGRAGASSPVMRTLLALASLIAGSSLASLAVAQDDTPRCTEVRPGFVTCTETQIEGRQPASWFLLSRSRITWEPPPLVRPDPAAELARTVRDAPF